MSDFELGMYHNWGVSQQHSMDGMHSVVTVDGKHHAEFRGKTAKMAANRHAMDLVSKRRLTAKSDFDVTRSGHEYFKDVKPGESTLKSPTSRHPRAQNASRGSRPTKKG